jgi:hypothetical protein
MMWFLVVYLCFSKKYLGSDMRKIEETTSMAKIHEIRHNRDILDLLQSNAISNEDKFGRIKNCTHSIYNHIMNGGLTRDWDFDIERELYHS